MATKLFAPECCIAVVILHKIVETFIFYLCRVVKRKYKRKPNGEKEIWRFNMVKVFNLFVVFFILSIRVFTTFSFCVLCFARVPHMYILYTNNRLTTNCITHLIIKWSTYKNTPKRELTAAISEVNFVVL